MQRPGTRTGRHVVRAAGACLLLAVSTLLVVAGPSQADVIPGAITSITTDASRVDEGDEVRFSCTWQVPDGSQPGDTFELTLPTALKWYGAKTFRLVATDGSIVATAAADASGHVVFTLADYVASHPRDIHGTCSFVTLYTAAVTGGEENLDFHVGDTVITVPVDTGEPCPPNCPGSRDEAGKDMWWLDAEQTMTRSVIWTPATTADTTTVTVTDTPRPGLSLICSSVTAHIGPHLGANGKLSEPYDDQVLPAEVSCAPDRLVVTWSKVPPGEYAEVRLNANVADPDRTEYSNDAQVSFDGTIFPVDSHVIRTNASGTGSGAASTPTTTPSPTTTIPTNTTTTTSPTSTSATTSSATTALTARPGQTSHAELGPTSTTSVAGSALAFTGFEAAGLVTAGLGLLACGGAVLLAAHRSGQHR